MILSWVWLGMVLISLVTGLFTGRLEQVSQGALSGAGAGVELVLSMAGVVCLWSGVMEVMRRSGLADKLSTLLRRPLGFLFPSARKDPEAMEYLAANSAANMLGLGNAATPMGLKAAQRLHVLGGGGAVAPDSLCMLVVLNTASIQLLPVTVAGVRAAEGAAAPFDILPAVWLSSALSVTVGILAAKFLAKVWRKDP